MVTTKKIPIEDTQKKMKKQSKLVSIKHQQNTKEDSNWEKEGKKKSYKIENNL